MFSKNLIFKLTQIHKLDPDKQYRHIFLIDFILYVPVNTFSHVRMRLPGLDQ